MTPGVLRLVQWCWAQYQVATVPVASAPTNAVGSARHAEFAITPVPVTYSEPSLEVGATTDRSFVPVPFSPADGDWTSDGAKMEMPDATSRGGQEEVGRPMRARGQEEEQEQGPLGPKSARKSTEQQGSLLQPNSQTVKHQNPLTREHDAPSSGSSLSFLLSPWKKNNTFFSPSPSLYLLLFHLLLQEGLLQ
ncbi:hypothetical protein B7463_g1321, partial [Scytalidium lignicola]